VQLREIPVADVNVQIGVGSPIPVSALVSGSWPDLCAQLAEMHQEIKGSTVEIRLLATPKDETCPPDMLGLPFGIAIPFNMVELPEGEYTVTVNGVSTTFGWVPLLFSRSMTQHQRPLRLLSKRQSIGTIPTVLNLIIPLLGRWTRNVRLATGPRSRS